MKRRLLVAASGALLTGLGARRSAVAQEKVRRVGLLSNGARGDGRSAHNVADRAGPDARRERFQSGQEP